MLDLEKVQDQKDLYMKMLHISSYQKEIIY